MNKNIKIFLIFILIILADRDCNPISISSEYASAKQLSIGVNTEFTMELILTQKQELLKQFKTKGEWASLEPLEYYDPFLDKWLVEIFRPIKDYEGLYEISDLGRVKSVERTITKSGKGTKFIRERILRYNTNLKGYRYVILSKNSKLRNFTIHKLVWQSFGDAERKEKVIDHITENKLFNWIKNLQLLSNRENRTKSTLASKTLPIGVSYIKKTNNYIAKFSYNNRSIHLGTFKTIGKASQAYQSKLIEINNA